MYAGTQSILERCMSMNLIQFQSGLSIAKFFQQFAIQALCTAILEKALGSQSFSCSHCGGTAPRFVRNIFQCRSCRHQTSLRLSVLFKSTKLSLTIWLLGIHLISQTWTNLSALALKYLGHQLSQLMAFGVQQIRFTMHYTFSQLF